jgi:hypothetical protein
MDEAMERYARHDVNEEAIDCELNEFWFEAVFRLTL